MDFIAFIMSLFFVISPPGTPIDEEEYGGTMSYENALMILSEVDVLEEDSSLPDVEFEYFTSEEPSCLLDEECEYVVDNEW